MGPFVASNQANRAQFWLGAVMFAFAGCQSGALNVDGQGQTASNPSLVDPATNSAPQSLVALPIRHLLARELLASYDALLGNNVSQVVPASVLTSDASPTAFDNDVSLQSMSAVRLDGYMTAAKLVSEAALSGAQAPQILGCEVSAISSDCITQFVRRFGRRAFRRPLTDDEVATYSGLFASEASKLDGAKLVLRALLSAPSFLYQPEVGDLAASNGNIVRLSPAEVATKLSLLLLGTGPSDQLLSEADGGHLSSPTDIAAAASAMLASPAGKAYLRYFALNWLGLGDAATNGLTGSAIDTAQLHADMPEEALRLFDDYAAPGAHFADVYVAPYTYVTPSLAAAYNVSPPPANSWAKVDLTGKPRLGLLTTPAVLNVTGLARYPAIKRGKYVLERLLCQSAGSPPASASSVVLPADAVGQSERAQLAAHLSNPACQGCHNVMDPPGFGFEQYGADGNYMQADSKGRALTGEGAIAGDAGFSFVGAPDLARHLATSDAAQACIALKLAQYLLGRPTTAADAALIAALDASLRQQDLPSTLLAFVRSDVFLTRRTT